jgi:hypothetical protein
MNIGLKTVGLLHLSTGRVRVADGPAVENV